MGRVASSVDNSMIESLWSTMQRELLDQSSWATPDRLGSAIFEWIEAWYNPRRRHTSLRLPCEIRGVVAVTEVGLRPRGRVSRAGVGGVLATALGLGGVAVARTDRNWGTSPGRDPPGPD